MQDSRGAALLFTALVLIMFSLKGLIVIQSFQPRSGSLYFRSEGIDQIRRVNIWWRL